MLYIELPETHSVRPLPFFLAMEEYVARHLVTHQGQDYFFMWQVPPTVIYGRNQQLEQEVNLDYCREHQIQVVHRKSGGGCVYADMNNIMLSFVTSQQGGVGFSFNRFINMILLVLRKLGVEAVGTTHNDVMIGDRKVSGTASYHLPNADIVHGTLLYDTNMEHMLKAITPSREKLQSKGIQSVRQRITLLKDHVSVSIGEVKTLIRETLCDGTRMLNTDEVSEIEKMTENYEMVM